MIDISSMLALIREDETDVIQFYYLFNSQLCQDSRLPSGTPLGGQLCLDSQLP